MILILSLFTCSKDSTSSDEIISIEDVLVKNNEISGWTYNGSGWVANNFSELTIYINGAAEIYQRHGFTEAAHQAYQGTIDNSDRQLQLNVFNMGNEKNAQAIYEDPDIGLSGALEWNDGAGNAAHYMRYGGLSQILAFYRKTHFVYLQINYDTEESLNILKQFALNVDGNIK
jgi:hypothetical protein